MEARRYFERIGFEDAGEALCSEPLSEGDLLSVGMVYRPGEVCHTLTSSNANLYWLRSPDRVGFLPPTVIASFMGMGRRGVFPTARRLIRSDYTLNYCLAESVHYRVAHYCAAFALDQCSGLHTIGSLYSGAFDALAHGFASAGTLLSSRFQSEQDPLKRSVLEASSGTEVIYSTVEEAAKVCPVVDVLVASPSCHEVSTAGCSTSQEAAAAVAGHLRCILGCLHRAHPRAVVIEQSYGLCTHHPESYDIFCRGLASVPYRVYHRSLDAHVHFCASHYRRRLLWVMLRM